MNIIVTGASKGIGRELARIFSKDEGHRVLAVSRNVELLEKLIDECTECRSEVIIFPYDLTSGDISGLVNFVKVKLGNVDILINNAGSLVNKPLTELDDKDFDQVFDTNVRAPFTLIKSLLPYIAEEGHILNIGSMGGYQGSAKFPGLSLYSASKGALAILTECLAEELKEYKIKVNCLALGSARTEMLEAAFPGYDPPLSAGEMAEFIASFALTGHHYFNGKILPVSSSTP